MRTMEKQVLLDSINIFWMIF